MTPKSIKNYTVSIDNMFMDEVCTKSGVKLFRDTTFNPYQYATTNGVVTATPLKSNNLDIELGDQLFFSYQVIMDREQRDRDSDVHRNLVFLDQQKHWMVDTSLIYFSVRNDQIIMQNGYTLMDILQEQIKSTLIIPEYLKTAVAIGKARVIASGAKDVEKDDVIMFENRFVETYELWGNEYYILKESRVLAKECE